MGADAIDTTFEHVRRFNEQIGPAFYPRVQNTECKLREDVRDFVLTGVADVVADRASDGIELVDYKASQRPSADDSFLEDYREQLLVYAGLYRAQKGVFPDEVTIYFLGEDDVEDTKLRVEFDEADVEVAMDRFEETVRELEETRVRAAWDDLDEDLPDEATCDECDFRWDCPARNYDDR